MARGGVGALTVSLGLDAAQFTDGLNKAQQQAQKFSDQVKSIAVGTELGRRLGQVTDQIGRAFFDMTKGAIDAADHLNDLSKKTGIAVETLGGIGFAAGQAGGNLESVTAAAGKLNKTIAEAAGGNKQAIEAFKAIGISVTDASGKLKTADVVLADVADRFEQWEDGPEKAALAIRLFSKAGADIIPLLDDGGKSLRENIEYFKKYSGVSSETSRRADEFNDTLGKLRLVSSGFGQAVAADLLPPLQNLATLWLENKEKGNQFHTAAEPVANIIKAAGLAAGTAAIAFVQLGKTIGGVAAAFVAFHSFKFSEALAISKDVFGDMAKATKQVGDLFDAIYDGQKKTETSGTFHAADNYGDRLKGRAPGLTAQEAAAAAAALLKKQLDGQIKTIHDFANQQKDAYEFANRYVEGAYQAGLLSQRDFFAEQKRIRDAALVEQLSAIDKETAALKAARAKTQDAPARQEIDNKIAEAAQRRAQAVARASEAELLANQANAQAAEQLKDRYEELKATVKSFRGDDAGAAAIRNAQQLRDAARLVNEAQGDSKVVDDLRRQLDLQTKRNELEKSYAQLREDAQRREEDILVTAKLTGQGELEVLAAVREARTLEIAQLREKAEIAAAIASQKDSTAADAKRAADLALAVKKAAAEIDPLAAKFNGLFEDSFSNAFAGFLAGTKSAKDAFKDFANSVIAEIANIAAKNLAKSIFGDLGGSSGIGGFLSSLFGSRGGTISGAISPGGDGGYSGYYSAAVGIESVPYDGFKASLHKGEKVTPARYNGAAGGAMSVIVNAPPGTQVARQEERTGANGRTLEVWLDMAEARVAAGVATGTSKTAAAIKGRLGTGPGSLARRA